MRSKFLLSLVLMLATLAAAVAPALPVGAQAGERPRTGFEKSDGANWTTHEEELAFLADVDRLSERVTMEVIGRTLEDRPMHLVKVGEPAPHSRLASQAQPTIMFVCSQHGNEPAGRETCLKLLRDLAFTDDPVLVEQLSNTTMLFVPSANPDGSAANTRENSQGVDVNRDHLNLETREAQAIAEVVRLWKPDVSLDLHEYGPSVPVLYDDEVLYLWPRNLNVDQQVHDLAKTLAEDYIASDAEEQGYTADEYGLYAAGDQNVQQTAGDEDEGIMRNAMGLRHSLGILIESAVTQDPRNGPEEATDDAAVNRRRVESQMVVSHSTLRFMREVGVDAMRATEGAPIRKKREGFRRNAPVYFYGADNDPPEEGEYQDPPPCGYRITTEQLGRIRRTLELLGISTKSLTKKGDRVVTMAQPAEPLVALLLDERARRHAVAAKVRQKCPLRPVQE